MGGTGGGAPEVAGGAADTGAARTTGQASTPTEAAASTTRTAADLGEWLGCTATPTDAVGDSTRTPAAPLVPGLAPLSTVAVGADGVLDGPGVDGAACEGDNGPVAPFPCSNKTTGDVPTNGTSRQTWPLTEKPGENGSTNARGQVRKAGARQSKPYHFLGPLTRFALHHCANNNAVAVITVAAIVHLPLRTRVGVRERCSCGGTRHGSKRRTHCCRCRGRRSWGWSRQVACDISSGNQQQQQQQSGSTAEQHHDK